VLIEAQFADYAATGTGIIYDESGLTVTNAHVVEGAVIIKAYVQGIDRWLSAQLVGLSTCEDLAVIDISGEGYVPATLGDSDEMTLGEEVIALGYPLASELGDDLTINRGVVSKLHAQWDEYAHLQGLIQTDTDINPGNSGGPLVDMRGQVIGINTLGMSYSLTGRPVSGINFAIASSHARPVIGRLASGENPLWIGINAIPNNADVAWYFDLSVEEGLFIYGVSDNSPAADAGVEAGDVLTRMKGIDVYTMADVCDILRTNPEGNPVATQVIRGNKVLEGEVWGEELSEISDIGPTPTPSPQMALLYSDDFSDPSSGWYVSSNEDSEKGYSDGEYYVLVKRPNLVSWGYPGRTFTDFRLEVDARKVGGPDNNQFGVIVRRRDNDNFYMFVIASNGYYGAWKRVNGEWETLMAWNASPHINQGQSTNRLTVMAQGPNFSFHVNGEHLVDVTDASFAGGDIGLVAGAYDEVGVRIHFDNLKVWGSTPLPDVEATPTPTLSSAQEALLARVRWRSNNGTPIFAYYTDRPPTLDGYLGEWTGTVYAVNHVVYKPENWYGPSDLSGTFYIAWDEDHLYLGIEVFDDQHVQASSGKMLYQGDDIELQLDVNLLDDFNETKLSGDDGQVGLTVRDLLSGEYEAYAWRPPSLEGPLEVALAARQTTSGYVLETALPWWALNLSPRVETPYGFCLSLGDNDSPGTAAQESMVSTAPEPKWGDPTTWGTLILVDW